MYSVLIQNQKTMESFLQHHSIFADALNQKKIDTCLWMEAGTTIDTAIPELYALIEDKKEWRAVIVRVEDEEDQQMFPSDAENPYDFTENVNEDTQVKESSIPLIRLTQMLGGIPAPRVQFECRQVFEENKTPKSVYFPKSDVQDLGDYEKLCRKYHFYGNRPTEIIMVSLRCRQKMYGEELRKFWEQRRENESSEFWRRNGYPSICRYLFYEISKKGNSQRIADLFCLWVSVLLISTNEIPPDTMQAYRLYCLKVDFNEDAMTDRMQAAINWALGARLYIKNSLQRELKEKLKQEILLPDYKLETPVIMDVTAEDPSLPEKTGFGLAAASISLEMSWWEKQKAEAEEKLRALTDKIEWSVKQTASRMREYCVYSSGEVSHLDEYQVWKFKVQLDGLKNQIDEMRCNLDRSKVSDQETISSYARYVKEKLLRRMTRQQAVWTYVFVCAIFLLSFMPVIVHGLEKNDVSFKMGCGTAVIGMAVFAAGELFVLLKHRFLLHRGIKRFSGFLHKEYSDMLKNVSAFSDYLSAVASYIHGNSYLELLKKKGSIRVEMRLYRQEQMAALNAFLFDLQKWAGAFYLPVKLDGAGVEEEMIADTEPLSYFKEFCSFDDEDSCHAFLNFTGEIINSPFPFVERLQIIREELYDDAQ